MTFAVPWLISLQRGARLGGSGRGAGWGVTASGKREISRGKKGKKAMEGGTREREEAED